jgi:PAS domain S-box-containing protein
MAEVSVAEEFAKLGTWEWYVRDDRLILSPELVQLTGIRETTCEAAARHLHPADVPRVREAFLRALRDKSEFSIECHVRRAEHGEVTMSARGRVFYDENGEPVGLVGVAQDITERRAAEEALRRSEERHRALVEQATDIIAALDSGGKFLSLNPAFERITGWPADEWIGRDFADCLEEGSEGVARGFFDAVMRGDIAPRELTMRKRGGGSVVVEMTAKATTRGHVLDEIVCIARDVTVRKQVEAQLEQEKRLASLGQLAASVAHEFNNVLMSILPFAELLKRRTDPNDARAGVAAEHIFQAVRRGREVSREILRFARPPSLTLTSVDVGAWMTTFSREAAAMLGPRYAITTRLPDSPAWIHADRALLHQIATNLVINSRDAMPSGGKIILSARIPAPGKVAISVRDEGSGIPAAILPRIFDPLFTTKKAGTGLGLSIAFASMLQQGGSLDVTSKEEEGSEFTMTFAATDPPADAPVVFSGQSAPSRRVLLVEDEVSVGEGISALLSEEGFEVRLVERGSLAVQAFDEFAPDIAILDMNLPDMSGLDVLERLRARHAGLPVIISTGQADANALESIRNLGIPSIRKPYEISDLLAMLARLEPA